MVQYVCENMLSLKKHLMAIMNDIWKAMYCDVLVKIMQV